MKNDVKKDVKEAVKWLRSGWRQNPFARFIPSERRKADIADLLLKLSAELENVTQRKTRTEETSVNPEKVASDDTVKSITITIETDGAVGDFYLDTTTGESYVCTAQGVWKSISSSTYVCVGGKVHSVGRYVCGGGGGVLITRNV